jgi:hypothetical protein
MRMGLIAGVIGILFAGPATAADTPAAERTRNKLLKVKVTLNVRDVSLREVLKEVAAQVEMQAEKPIMWSYAPDVAAGDKITYACNNKPVEQVLDEIGKLTGIGYVVVSKDDHKHDGWIRITKGPERGYGKYPPDDPPEDPDEAKAAMRLKVAKELLDMGKTADARAVLMLVIEKHPKTKAAAEAKALMEKLKQ